MKLKNIFGKEINVNNQPIAIDMVFEEEETQEIKNLIKHKYLEQVI